MPKSMRSFGYNPKWHPTHFVSVFVFYNISDTKIHVGMFLGDERGPIALPYTFNYFGDATLQVTARALCVSMALGNFLSDLLGGMPIYHDAGGLAAH